MDKSIINVKDSCYGCGICVKKCPFGAISLEENEEGFLYPKISEELCKNCGKCTNECTTAKKENVDNLYKVKAYMAIAKDKDVYDRSASGGFATVISKYVIQNMNGIVYGCNLDEDGNVKHIRIDKIEDLKKIQDSKYVQSQIVGILDELNKDVKDKKVLFIGTPCQVDAVKKIVDKKYAYNLITCDLVCHGVPSPKLFKNYFKFLSEKYNKKVKEYRFRNKSTFDKCGFRGKVIFDNKKGKYIFSDYDLYYKDFLQEKNFRKSCYQCKYKEEKRVGDFSLGDVNTWEEYYDFYPDLSSSLVIVNNKLASKLLENLRDFIDIREIDFEKEKNLNKALSRQTPYPKDRDIIYERYKDLYQYDKEINKKISLRQKIKNQFKKYIPFKFRIAIKKFLKGRLKNK